MSYRNDGRKSDFSIFGGLDKLLNFVSDMVENGKDEANIRGEIKPDENHNSNITGKYGFNIKLGANTADTAEKLKTFNDLFGKKSGGFYASELAADVFEDEDEVTIVAELPNTKREDIQLLISDKTLSLNVCKNGICHTKNVELKFIPDINKTSETFNNSIYSAIIKR